MAKGRRGSSERTSTAGRIPFPIPAVRPSTVHGFRSSARSWMAETGVPAEVAEACLAHVPRSRVVQAYQRSDLLERRAEVMQAWSDYVTPATGGRRELTRPRDPDSESVSERFGGISGNLRAVGSPRITELGSRRGMGRVAIGRRGRERRRSQGVGCSCGPCRA